MIRGLLNPQFYKGYRRFVRGMHPAANKIDVITNRSIALFVFFAALAGLGQAQPAAIPAAAAKKASASPARVAASHSAQTDAQLEKAIRERFAESKIAEDKFEVHVQGGRATITGNTN